jgi:multicomponent Na+:H+ antiporter subunit D
MTRRSTLLAAAELLAWCAALAVLWLLLVRTLDTLELAVGVAPGFAEVVAHAVNESGSGGVMTSVHWNPAGVLLGLASTLLAVGLAAVAVARPQLLAAPDWALPLRRLQSGHVGDYVAWVLVGAAPLGALALPGVLGT